MATPTFRIGIDVGGTFTDLVPVHDGCSSSTLPTEHRSAACQLALMLGTRPRGGIHRGAGDYLGAGDDVAVTTLCVVRDPACSAAPGHRRVTLGDQGAGVIY